MVSLWDRADDELLTVLHERVKGAKRERFVVQTVTGYLTGTTSGWRRKGGLTAHVCDSLYLYEVVAMYRSEDRARNRGRTPVVLGREGAVAAAQEHAARLNRG